MTTEPNAAAERRDMSGLRLALQNPAIVALTYVQKRPRLPSPHQVAIELYDTLIDKKITSKRSLV